MRVSNLCKQQLQYRYTHVLISYPDKLLLDKEGSILKVILYVVLSFSKDKKPMNETKWV